MTKYKRIQIIEAIGLIKKDVMEKEQTKIPDFDDIVFECRNKEYGAYILRRKYPRTLLASMVFGIGVIAVAVIVPYLNAKAMEGRQVKEERVVEIKMENLDQPSETVAPPPAPPPPVEEVVQQTRYIPPVVVDSVKPEESGRLLTAEDARIEIRDADVLEIIPVAEVMEEVREEEPEPEPFIVVEEMPMFPGGQSELNKFLHENAQYPEIAKENNVQGRVIVKFCVTPSGGVDKVSILKGVDPELDNEAMRVVSILPLFKPGKQGGKPVPVWYTVWINFQLN